MRNLAKLEKVGFEESLGRHVLPSLCIGCASCVAVCPIKCLEYINERPVLTKDCISCGICSRICPRYGLSIPELERYVFGRERRSDEEFGVYRRIVFARTRIDRIRRVCQDGGVVTSVLLYALEKGVIDGAVLSGIDGERPLKAVPKLAESREEIIGSAGTRYTYSPNILALRDAATQGKESLAFVGTPCQIQVIRRIQMLPLNRYAKRLSFTIGLFCSECFSYDGLVNDLLRRKLGIDPKDVVKMNIKGRLIITTSKGIVKEVSLKEAKRYASNCVLACPDFSAELADISVGGLGLDGWSLTILRTELGEKIFDEAESEGFLEARSVEHSSKALSLLVKLSRRKRQKE